MEYSLALQASMAGASSPSWQATFEFVHEAKLQLIIHRARAVCQHSCMCLRSARSTYNLHLEPMQTDTNTRAHTQARRHAGTHPRTHALAHTHTPAAACTLMITHRNEEDGEPRRREEVCKRQTSRRCSTDLQTPTRARRAVLPAR